MKTKLIALVALAVADFAFLQADVAAGAEFEADADHAEGLLTDGKAKLADAPLAPPAAGKAKVVKARVLTACAYGQANDLAELPADVAKQAEKEGLVDTDKAAVAYAATLRQNQAKKQG
jgi:hypothetical protein